MDRLATKMRLTPAELAKFSAVGVRTVERILLGVSPESVQSLSRLLGVVGLKLGVVKRPA